MKFSISNLKILACAFLFLFAASCKSKGDKGMGGGGGGNGGGNGRPLSQGNCGSCNVANQDLSAPAPGGGSGDTPSTDGFVGLGSHLSGGHFTGQPPLIVDGQGQGTGVVPQVPQVPQGDPGTFLPRGGGEEPNPQLAQGRPVADGTASGETSAAPDSSSATY